MAARTFIDTTGAHWEVFEVHRVSQNAGSVTAGLEGGWLSFVGEEEKRRLAPFPREWVSMADEELAALCAGARRALPSRITRTPPTATSAGGTHIDVLTSAPRADRAEVGGASRTRDTAEASDTDDVEAVVRDFTHAARAAGVAAIETMVRLRATLQERFPGEHPVARDMRRVRRWFVDAYYFERENTEPRER